MKGEINIRILTAIGNQNLNNTLKKEKEFEILENDIFYREGILEFLEKNKNIDILILYEKLYGVENKINLKKINIIFNKKNKYSINKKIAKNIFKEFKIIGNIKLNNYCDFLLNEKNNYKIENKKLKKIYLKIIKKLNC